MSLPYISYREMEVALNLYQSCLELAGDSLQLYIPPRSKDTIISSLSEVGILAQGVQQSKEM